MGTDVRGPLGAGSDSAGRVPAAGPGRLRRGALARVFLVAHAILLVASFSGVLGASAQAQTLTLTFSDNGSTVTIDAAGSLDFSAAGSRPDATIGIENAIYFGDTSIWAIGADSSGVSSLMSWYQLSALTTTVNEPFSGPTTAENLPNYSAEFFLRFTPFHNWMGVDPDNLTGDIYDPTGDEVTFTGTLQSTLGDNDFDIEHAFGNQKIVFKTASPATIPAAPTGLAATAGNAQVDLAWTNPNDSNITKYQVRYGAGATVPATATWEDISGSGAGTTTHTVSGLTNATGYAFEIRAVNARGNSTASATATPAEPDTTPSFGTGVTIADQTYTQNAAIATLTLPEATGGNGTLTYSLTPNAPAGLAFDATNRTLTGTPTTVQSATAYTYTVTDNDGDTASLTFNITVEAPAPAPAAPTGLAATAGDTAVTLNWTDPSDTSITKYQVRYGAGSTVPATATWDDIDPSDDQTTSHTVTGLTNVTQYAFEIRAVNANGNSDASNTVTATPALAVPDAPANLTASAGGTHVYLTWTIPTNTSSITNIQVRYKPAADLPFDDTTDLWTNLAATRTEFDAFDPTPDTEYRFQVRAINAAGNGAGERGERDDGHGARRGRHHAAHANNLPDERGHVDVAGCVQRTGAVRAGRRAGGIRGCLRPADRERADAGREQVGRGPQMRAPRGRGAGFLRRGLRRRPGQLQRHGDDDVEADRGYPKLRRHCGPGADADRHQRQHLRGGQRGADSDGHGRFRDGHRSG